MNALAYAMLHQSKLNFPQSTGHNLVISNTKGKVHETSCKKDLLSLFYEFSEGAEINALVRQKLDLKLCYA